MPRKLLTLIVCLMAAVSTTWAQTPPDNEIWYTTIDGKKAELIDGGALEENGEDFKVISHTYSNGKGVVRANNPIIEYGYVRIENIAFGLFFSGETLESITFPECTEYLHLDEDLWSYKLKRNKGLKAINCRYSSEDGRCIVIDGALIDFAPGGLTEYTIPKGVTSIGYECEEDPAFSYCTGLACITIPSSVRTIGDRAFQGCTGLTSISISSSVTDIGENAFYDCSNLKNVTVGNLYCFDYFTKLGVSNVTFGGRNASSDGRCLIFNGRLERFIATGLTSYDFPESITEISSAALNECKKLNSATIANYQCYDILKQAGISVSAFTGSNASSDGRYLISNGKIERFIATGLTTYDFPESVTDISSAALNECKKLNSATIANYQCYDILKQAGISISSFAGSNASTDGRCLIVNGELIIFIDDDATEYAIPQNVTKIKDGVFNICTGLTKITIPSGITAIGDQQFNGCSILASITCLAMVPPAISDLSIPETTMIYVLKDVIKEYKKDLNWEKYKKQIKVLK